MADYEEALTLAEAKQAWEENKDVVCPGCEWHIEPDEGYAVDSLGIVWHSECLQEEKRISACEDEEARLNDGL